MGRDPVRRASARLANLLAPPHAPVQGGEGGRKAGDRAIGALGSEGSLLEASHSRMAAMRVGKRTGRIGVESGQAASGGIPKKADNGRLAIPGR